MRRARLKLTLALAAAGTLAVAPFMGTTAHAASSAPTVRVVARGLNDPKYLTEGPGGLYVAESGTGGPTCIHAVGVEGAPTRFCVGETGVIARVSGGRTQVVLRGLPSSVEKDTGEALGPVAVAFRNGRMVILLRDSLPTAAGYSALPGFVGLAYGRLVAPVVDDLSVRLRSVADIGDFASLHPQPAATLGGTPGELTWDSDPHDVVPYRGGYAVADAGANDVLWVHASGRITVAGRLPSYAEKVPAGAMGPGSPAMTIDAQAVASSVAVSPDGTLYAGVLRGIPGLPGTAQVYRLIPGQAPTVAVSGLTRVSSIAFDRRGRLLILESNVGGALAPPTTPGALLRATLDPAGSVTATDLGVAGLVAPTGLAVGPGGAVYVSNRTSGARQGQILQITNLG